MARYFYGGTTTKNERARESFDVASAEIRDVALNGLNEEELEKGKTYLIGSYPLRFDTSAKIASSSSTSSSSAARPSGWSSATARSAR